VEAPPRACQRTARSATSCHADERAKLEDGEQPEHAGTDPQPHHVERRNEPDDAHSEPSLLPSRVGPDHDEVLRRPGGKCRREAGIHDEQRLPAVQESDAPAPPFTQVDVETARLRILRREFAEGQGPGKDEGCAAKPEAEGQRWRGEGTNELRRREKDADSNRVADDKRSRRPETEAPHDGLTL